MSDAAEGSGLSGRHYELWQPLLALAEWVDADGAMGLGERLRFYARELVTSTAESQVPDEDQTLLRCLAELIKAGRTPSVKQVVDEARRVDPELLKGMTARKAGEVLRRYGVQSTRMRGRREYRQVSPEQLKAIERSYGIDLNTEGDSRFALIGPRLY